VAAKAAFLLAERGPARLDEWGVPARFVDDAGTVFVNSAWRVRTEPEVPACI
jgi:hypothetical protein